MYSVLRFCLIAMVVAQGGRAKKSKTQEQPPAETAATETGTTAAPAAVNQSMGPIGAGIGFAVLFMAMVLYLCRKDYLEKIEEKEKAEAEAKALEEANQAEEQKPTQVGVGDGVELASLETCSTPGDAVVADRV